MRRAINWKFLAILLVATAIVGGGVHLLHGYQVRRNSSALLELARKEKDSNPRKAMEYFQRYLRFEPKDTDARAELGIVLEELGRKTRSEKTLLAAYFAYDRVLREDDTRDAIRRRLVDVAMEFRRYAEAKASLQVLISKTNAAELKFLMGQCEEFSNRYQDAERWYEQAALDPDTVRKHEHCKYYVAWANLKRNHLDKPEEADTIMDKMVKADPQCAAALLQRAAYLLDHRLDRVTDVAALDKQVLKKIEDATKAAPNDPDAVLLGARLAQVQGKTEQARQKLEQGIDKHPHSESLYVALANIYLREQKLEDALNKVRLGSTKNPESGTLTVWLANLVLQKGDVQEAEAILKRVRDKDSDPYLVRMLQVQLYTKRGEWTKAEPLLLELTTDPNVIDAIRKEAREHLGLCYEQMGNPDQALISYKEGLRLNPGSLPLRLGLVRVCHALGRVDEAVHECKQLVSLKGAPPEAHLMLVRLLITRALRQLPGQRDWREAQSALERAAKVADKSIDLPLMQAEIWLLADPKGKLADARSLLKKVREQVPESTRLLVAEAALRDNPEDGLKFLRLRAAEAEQPKLDDPTLLTQVEIGLTARLAANRAKAELPKFESAISKRPPAERARLLEALAIAYFQSDDDVNGRRLLEQMTKEPELDRNLTLRMVLFDLAAKENNHKHQQHWLKQIEEIEGPRGIYWRMAEAITIVNQARVLDREKLPPDTFFTARKRLDEVAKKRPSWHMVPSMQAEIAELEGRPEQALSHYQHAFILGERRPVAVRRLVELLLERRNYPEVERIIRELAVHKESLVSAKLGRIASLVMRQDKDLALDLAQRSYNAESKKYQDHLWFAQMMRALGEDKKAEDALESAIKLAPDEPQAWVVRIYFLAADPKRKEEARAEIAKAALAIPEAKRDAVLAACYEVVGDLAKAEAHYTADAERKQRDNVDAWRSVAAFYIRHGQGAKADPYLQKIIDAPGAPLAAITDARRARAFILAARGSFAAFKEGVALVQRNLELTKNSRVDQQALAALYASRPDHRKEALRLYQDLERSGTLEPFEAFNLARLYVADNNWPKAETTLQVLLGSAAGKNPAYVGYYASQLMIREDTARAALRIEELAKLTPDTLQVTELRAWVLRSQGKHDDAVALLLTHSRRKDADLGKIALILERMGKAPKSPALYLGKAEEIYREHLSRTPTQESLLALGKFLTEQNRFAEGLDCLEQAFAKGEPEPAAAVSIAMLRLTPIPDKEHSRVEGWLREALRKKPGSPALLGSLAELYDLQSKYGDAIAVYRKLLADRLADEVTLNNLAWLLALHDKQPAEALLLIQQAIDLAGPEAGLLDTRGVILLKADRRREALADLENAAALENNPGTHFHLAQAHLENKNVSEAQRAFRRAQQAGLSETVLHPLERADYAALCNRFGKTAP